MTTLQSNVKRKLLHVMKLSTVSVIALGNGIAMAQVASDTQGPVELDVVVVTGTKSGAAAIQDIPSSIQAVRGDTLEQIGATEFSDYAVRVPGLQYQDLGPGDKEYIIRGINSSGPSTVGVYYDEAVITGSNAEDGGGRNADIRLYDIERIEILKGPQGTLYGANSMSGTIRIITNKPQLGGIEGSAQAEISDTRFGGLNYNFNAMINLPVVEDKFAVRAVGWLNDNSGFIDAPRIRSGRVNDINSDNTEGGRFSARLLASEELTLDGTVTYQQTHSNGSSRFTPPGTLSYSSDTYPAVPGGDLINTDLTQSPWDEELLTAGFTATYDMGHGELVATTNYFDRKIDFSFDSSPILIFFGVDDVANTLQPQERSIWSNEIRYASSFDGPVNFVVGGYWQEEKSEFTVEVIRSNAAGLPNSAFSSANEDDALIGTGDTYFGRVSDFDLSQKAVFGEVTFKITDQLTALGGIRYFDSDYNASNQTTHPFAGFSDDFLRDAVPDSASASKTTFKANLSYEATDDVLFFATASQGFRVGGVNRPEISSEIVTKPAYGPDTLWNYEAGMKSSILENRANLNISVYTMRWSDMQVQARDATGAFTFLTNAGKAKVDGAELELNALFTEELEFFAGLSYQDAKLTEDAPDLGDADSRALDGHRMPNVPKFQANFAMTYTTTIFDDFDLTLHGDVTHRGSSFSEFNPANPLRVELESYELVNLRASIEKDGWKASVFVKNLFDERAQVDAINGTQDPLALITVRPRTIGASIKKTF